MFEERVCIAEPQTTRKELDLQRSAHLLLGTAPSCHFKLDGMLLCFTHCAQNVN